ncbi:SIS domain-containing protein [Staphylococcus pettenkoferi]|uniref:SIS domain-containing protein n=1 Tax=Staphylococcus pettenkoferi TaxID=170573 RepID=UPI00066E0E2E|nr:SIS domain-containing protein [Staphylococcus pettenkoferi]MCY1585331.1 SIS domain-containing protein [Staphylococcus pettenkoferi]MCY1627147.1 SIS domain-containing protein [Staphylococcus pettenkoferi]PNZ90065.1 SIS domain-containing protein [Staphylococcus pettenkoferi]QQC38380.1 SIS domain-containing protein [Staphylococcus pettenkoferi]UIK48994.1 SIS domain-containing protein [Staphylococcus pettenkoferi]
MLHETHTYKEIRQQPEMWRRTRNIVADRQHDFDAFVTRINDYADGRPVKVLFTGAGSSAYVGDTLRLSEINQLHPGWEFENVSTTHFVTNPQSFIESNKVYVVVSFARSGNSPETKGTVELANQITPHVFHIFITNNKDGFLAQYEADNIFRIVLPEETNDKSLAMTSSFSTMLLAAYLLFGGQVTDHFYETIEKYFTELEIVVNQVASNNQFRKVFYVGTGLIGELTREVALKLNELTGGRIEIQRETTLGFRHGPKAGLNDNSLFIMLRSNDAYRRRYETDLIYEIEDGQTDYDILILGRDEADSEFATELDFVADFNDFELALTYLIFGQLLASKKSVSFGLNPDNPSPDGFINRVVKGVTIYEYEG